MKKNLLIISSLFVVMLGACTKETPHEIISQNAKSSGSFLGFTMDGSSIHDRDYYKVIDSDSSIFEWRSFHEGDMLLDKEIVWKIDNNIYNISNIDKNSFDVEYENGDSIHIFNVSSTGSLTTFNIYNEEGDLVNISVTFDSTVNFMDVVSQITPGNSKIAIPPHLIYKAVLLVVTAVDTYFAIKCENIVREGTKRCTENHPHCRAIKHICSVECYTNVINCVCNCNQYSYHG